MSRCQKTKKTHQKYRLPKFKVVILYFVVVFILIQSVLFFGIKTFSIFNNLHKNIELIIHLESLAHHNHEQLICKSFCLFCDPTSAIYAILMKLI